LAETGRPDRPDYLPDLCSVPVIGSLILIVELVVVVIVIAPGQPSALPQWREFIAASFAAQWIALISAVLLCKLGPLMYGWPRAIGIAVSMCLPILVSIAGGYLLAQIDETMALGLIPKATSLTQFVLGIGLLTALTALVVLRYFYVHERWKRQVAAQARAQLDALHARIRPHFLFNTLNTAASLVDVEPRQAEQAILDLAELFRAALTPEGQDWPLDQELSLTRRYLEVEQLRLGSRLTVQVNCADGLGAIVVPQLCLQPLVENAIHHGIQKLPTGGLVSIDAVADAGNLTITVENPKPRIVTSGTNQHGNHIALGNIRDRLKLRHGANARLLAEDLGDRYRAVLILPLDAPG